jgi:hypothetical protein
VRFRREKARQAQHKPYFGFRLLILYEENWQLRFNGSQFEKVLWTDPYWYGSAAGLAIIPMAYGAVHLAALEVAFPTNIERLLWKAAGYILMGGAGGLALGFGFKFLKTWFLQKLQNGTNEQDRHCIRPSCFQSFSQRFHECFSLLLGPIFKYLWALLVGGFNCVALLLLPVALLVFICILCLYCASRIYIVIESFISLRRVPLGVYQTSNVSITKYIPHL